MKLIELIRLSIPVQNAVRTAGSIVLAGLEVNEEIMEKGEADYATRIDLEVQDFLVGELSSLLPGSNIITEESSGNCFDFRRPTWILDPVDGTTNLIYSYKHSAISLALLLEGRLTMGMVYNPYMNEMFTAVSGQGAFLNGKPIHVSRSASLAESLISFGTCPYDKSRADQVFTTAREAYLRCRDIRRSGAAALDLVYVASGRLDGFLEQILQPWDYAAGMLILLEAGGRITDWDGKAPSLSKASGILATNGGIHSNLLDLLSLSFPDR